MNALSLTAAALIGQALVGILIGPLGIGMLFFLNGICYLAVLVALGAISI